MREIRTKQVFELGGRGTFCKRFFVHMSCVPLPYLNYKKEEVTEDEFRTAYERCVPIVDLEGHQCKLCGKGFDKE